MGKNPKKIMFGSGSEYFKKIRFRFGLSSVNVGFRLVSVGVLHQWNWKDVSMEVIWYGLTVIVSTS